MLHKKVEDDILEILPNIKRYMQSTELVSVKCAITRKFRIQRNIVYREQNITGIIIQYSMIGKGRTGGGVGGGAKYNVQYVVTIT